MHLSVSRLKKLIPGFNEVRHTEDDFWRITKTENIEVSFWKLPTEINGFYGTTGKGGSDSRHIVINRSLRLGKWLIVGFHELIHHFLHVRTSRSLIYYSRRSDDRYEAEADTYALMMLIPKPLLLAMLQPGSVDREGFDEGDLRSRLRIYEIYGE